MRMSSRIVKLRYPERVIFGSSSVNRNKYNFFELLFLKFLSKRDNTKLTLNYLDAKHDVKLFRYEVKMEDDLLLTLRLKLRWRMWKSRATSVCIYVETRRGITSERVRG